jgi:outer membrane protein assembly factor BamB
MAAKRDPQRRLVYVGIRGCVVALDHATGALAWSVELKRGSTFVPVFHDSGRVFATSGGEVTCLDAATGKVLWHNPLKGYGLGYAMIAGAPDPVVAAVVAEMEAAAATSAAGSTAAAT